MDDREILEVEIGDLKNAIDKISQALNDLKDVQNIDEQYKSLDIAMQDLEDRKSDLEIEYDYYLEQDYYEENKDQWEAEKRQERWDYDRQRL